MARCSPRPGLAVTMADESTVQEVGSRGMIQSRVRAGSDRCAGLGDQNYDEEQGSRVRIAKQWDEPHMCMSCWGGSKFGM